MVRQRAKAIKKVEDNGSWIAKAMETIRDLVSQGETIDKFSFSSAMEINDTQIAEERLRKLTNLGWLHMSADRDDSGTFVKYIWRLR